MAVFGITRVSTFDQTEGTSLDVQRKKVGAVAALADLVVDHIYEDAGISGSVPLSERPQGGAMVQALQAGDTVIANKIDRIFRNAADALATVEKWKAMDVKLIIAEFGADPVTENGTSKLLFGILSMVAEFERQTILDRTSSGRAEKKAKGGHIGGSSPFGYLKIGEGKGAMLEPVEAQQHAIDRMVSLKEGGESLRSIANIIMDEFGFKVSHVAVKGALQRRIELQMI